MYYLQMDLADIRMARDIREFLMGILIVPINFYILKCIIIILKCTPDIIIITY